MLCRQQQQLSVACTLPQHSDAEKLTNVFPGIWTWALTAVITTGGNTARTLARKTNNIYTLAKAAAFSTYIFPLVVVVVAASSAQRSQSTICSHCDYTYMHTFMLTLTHTNTGYTHGRTHTNAWTLKSVSHVFLLIFACVCFRLLRGLYVCVYLCEHLALALSHLDSLRHAGETNTNALQAAGNVCLAWPLSWPHLPPLLLAITAPPQRQLLSLGPPLLQINVSGGDFFPFFLPALSVLSGAVGCCSR